MELLGVGPLELIFVFILTILIFGPKDLTRAGKTIGQFLNKIVRSEGWQAIQEVNREIKMLPNRLVSEAGLDEPLADILEDRNAAAGNTQKNQVSPTDSDDIVEGMKAWTTPPDDAQAHLGGEADSSYV